MHKQCKSSHGDTYIVMLCRKRFHIQINNISVHGQFHGLGCQLSCIPNICSEFKVFVKAIPFFSI